MFDLVTGQWSQIPAAGINLGPMRQGAVAGVTALINNRLYFHGGQDGNTMYSDLWSFDLAAKRFDALKFSTAVPRPAERWQGNMITRSASDKMYIYCGQSQNSFLNGAFLRAVI